MGRRRDAIGRPCGRLSGAAAELRWGYRSAARVGAWTITIDPPAQGEPPRPVRRWLTADVVEQLDPIALTQHRSSSSRSRRVRCRWPVLSVVRSDRRLRAELARYPYRQRDDMSRFVRPETERLELTDGDWMLVKRRLTAGEQRRAFEPDREDHARRA